MEQTDSLQQTEHVTEPPTEAKETEPPEKHIISEQIITDAFSSLNYNTGLFPINIVEVLSQCAKYSASFATYEDTKWEHLDATEMATLKYGEYAKYLDNAYFVTATGKILHNPEIPNYYADEAKIVTALLLFNERDELVKSYIVYRSEEFNTCAILLATPQW